MNLPDPVHPLVVHLPLALALVVPVLGAGALLAWSRDWLPGKRAWAVVVALQAALALGAWAALGTGQAEEDRVERVVGESALEAHEEAAQLFLGAAAGTLVLSALALLAPGGPLPRATAAVAVAGMALTTLLAVRVGKAGGELVYRHGAASAYAVASSVAPVTDRDDDRKELR